MYVHVCAHAHVHTMHVCVHSCTHVMYVWPHAADCRSSYPGPGIAVGIQVVCTYMGGCMEHTEHTQLCLVCVNFCKRAGNLYWRIPL